MRSNILDFYAHSHTPFLHGAGKKGTDYLIQLLELNGQEKVLEIGFGTGASQVKLQSRFPDLQIYGIEKSALMLRKAKRRLKFSLLAAKDLYLLDKSSDYPFPANTFDVVFLESVLGILSLEKIRQTLKEAKRVMKEGGILAFNETIWLEGVRKAERKKINEICLKEFGIVQAQEELSNVKQWGNFLEEQGFAIDHCSTLPAQIVSPTSGFREYLSAFFSTAGKISQKLSHRQQTESRRIKNITSQFFQANEKYLDCYFFKLRK